MSLAAFDLRLRAMIRLAGAMLVVNCSGSAEDSGGVSINMDDAAVDVEPDTSRDASRNPPGDSAHGPDTSVRPPEAGRDSSLVADVLHPDVAIEKPPPPPLCIRLQDPKNPNHTLALSQGVDDQYLVLIRSDCRVANAIHPPGGTPALIAWRNLLYAWNPDLWGCTDHPATGFALVSSAFNITSFEAARLIDLYIEASTKVLELNLDEVAQLRQDLERLAHSTVTSESNDTVLSSCGQDAGVDADAAKPLDASSIDASDEPITDAGADESRDGAEASDGADEPRNDDDASDAAVNDAEAEGSD